MMLVKVVTGWRSRIYLHYQKRVFCHTIPNFNEPERERKVTNRDVEIQYTGEVIALRQ